MNRFLTALQFLTRIPLWRTFTALNLADSFVFFPVIGGLIGCYTAGIFIVTVKFLPPPLAAFTAIMATVALTGALHEDGLADCADAFGCRQNSPEARLLIMRDPHCGTYGICALISSFGLRVIILSFAPDSLTILKILIVSGMVSRALLPTFMVLLPLASESGLAARAGLPSYKTLIVIWLFTVLVVILCLPWPAIIMVLCVSTFSLLYVFYQAKTKLKGFNGDVLGALQQLCELSILSANVALW